MTSNNNGHAKDVSKQNSEQTLDKLLQEKNSYKPKMKPSSTETFSNSEMC